MEKRKKDHIDLAFDAQILKENIDSRFYYEPMLNPHPQGIPESFKIHLKTTKVPIWVSSMTGGSELAGKINRNLASICKLYGMGMGLGSCRIILDDDRHLPDFDMRDIIGDENPLFANLGVAQLEELMNKNEFFKVHALIERLRADGLIIHVNPMQEWFQPEGDRFMKSPLQIVREVLAKLDYPVIVKEVGQGMGYHSLKALLELPLLAVEFAAFGGTNFAKLELMRGTEAQKELFEPLSKVGHDAYQMTAFVNRIVDESKVNTSMIIVSGGIKNFLDGYYLIQKCKLPAIYGQASSLLKHAKESFEDLKQYVEFQVEGLKLAYNYLKIRELK